MYVAVAILVVAVPAALYAFAPARSETATPQAASQPPPATPKYRDTALIEMVTGPDVDVLKEQFDLDGAGTLLIQPPFDESQVTLGLSRFRRTAESVNVLQDAAVVTQVQTLALGAPAVVYFTGGRVFSVALETASSETRTPERSRRFRYQFRITEQ